ncbi:MAG: type II secretion system F family protein [Lentisphaeria bacterium]
MDTVSLLILALVFAAVFLAVLVVLPLFSTSAATKAKDDFNQGEASSASPISRFISPEQLHKNCWSAAVGAGATSIVVLLFAGVYGPWFLLPLCLIAGAIAFQLPKAWLNWKVKQRTDKFIAGLMDLTFGLASALRAGVSLPQALESVSHNMGGPIQEEIGFLLREYRLGVDLPDGLTKLCRRIPSEDLFLLATSVRLTLQSGGSLAEVLEKITDTIRNRSEFQQKLKTMTAQGRFEAIAMASAPVAAFIVLFAIDPDLMRPLVTTRIGYMALAFTVLLELIGFFWIRKIVTIED